jgi:hypothetical protein
MHTLIRCSLIAAAAATSLAATDAWADEQANRHRGAITTDTVVITGRRQEPVAAIAVLRLEPRITLVDLKVALLDRIERAAWAEPF